MYRCQEMPVFVCNAVLADKLWDPLQQILFCKVFILCYYANQVQVRNKTKLIKPGNENKILAWILFSQRAQNCLILKIRFPLPPFNNHLENLILFVPATSRVAFRDRIFPAEFSASHQYTPVSWNIFQYLK